MAVDGFENARQQLDVLLQADALACLDQVLLAYAAVLGVVQQQIGKFPALLDQSNVGEAMNSLGESRNADHLAQYDSGVVEAQRLVKVANKKVVLRHSFPDSSMWVRFLGGCGRLGKQRLRRGRL